MNKLSFVTLFPGAEPVHLKKGVGMIPYILQRDFDFSSRLVCSPKNDVAASLESAGISVHYLWPSSVPVLVSAAWYILRHGRSADVLNLYHQSRSTLFLGWLYKKWHPRGLLYLKLDANPAYLEQLAGQPTFPRHVRAWNRFFGRTADIVTTESQMAATLLKQYYPAIQDKLLYLPNGTDRALLEQYAPAKVSFADKEQLILTAGRIGAPEKNHRLLLEALAQINMKDWKMVFAGPLNPAFETEIDTFCQAHPGLRGRLLFTGPLSGELYDWYRRAKIFVLSSSRENFPLVLPEAMYYGCTIVATDAGCIREVLDNGAAGDLVTDAATMAQRLQFLIDTEQGMQERFDYNRAKALSTYSWTNIVSGLNERIRSLLKTRNT